jgi:hypothetical protein
MRRVQVIAALLAGTLAAALAPAAAGAASLVPQENSAVSQYTEGFPTGGGEKGSSSSGDSHVTPGQAIGADNAKKLDQRGAEGRAAAEVAAATSPLATSAGSSGGGDQRGVGKSRGGQHGNGGNGATRGGDGQKSAAEPSSAGAGSGAVGTLAEAATGTDSRELGVILPLFLLAALIWGAAYAVRSRERSAAQ